MAAIRSGLSDRVPVMMLKTKQAIKIVEATYLKFPTEPRALSETLIGSALRYGYDQVWVCAQDWIELEAIGSKIKRGARNREVNFIYHNYVSHYTYYQITDD